MGEVLGVVGMAGVVVAGVLLVAARKAAEKAATTGVERWFKSETWKTDLARELEKTRGVERQEIRFRAYGTLFGVMRPLAMYGQKKTLDRKKVKDLGTELSNWYFSPEGGLLLTAAAREFYFSLQELIRGAIKVDGWVAVVSDFPEGEFKEVLQRQSPPITDVQSFLDGTGPDEWLSADAFHEGKCWRKSLEVLVDGDAWTSGLSDTERFAVLQQVSSRLRTVLTNDVESRLP